MGTVYTVSEIRAIADYAHSHGMYLHMDGARISNAAAFLGLGFKDYAFLYLSCTNPVSKFLGGNALRFIVGVPPKNNRFPSDENDGSASA